MMVSCVKERFSLWYFFGYVIMPFCYVINLANLWIFLNDLFTLLVRLLEGYNFFLVYPYSLLELGFPHLLVNLLTPGSTPVAGEIYNLTCPNPGDAAACSLQHISLLLARTMRRLLGASRKMLRSTWPEMRKTKAGAETKQQHRRELNCNTHCTWDSGGMEWNGVEWYGMAWCGIVWHGIGQGIWVDLNARLRFFTFWVFMDLWNIL